MAAWCAAILIPAGASATEVPDTLGAPAELVLTISLDESEFVHAAPIPVAVRLSNTGRMPVEITPLGAAYSYVTFSVETSSGERVHPSFERDWPGRVKAGLILEPKGIESEIIDLMLFFGDWDPEGRTIDQALKLKALPSGHYKVRANYWSRPDRTPASIIHSNAIEFTIVPLAAHPGERQLVDEFLKGWNWDQIVWDGQEAYCQKWLKEFRDSQYLRKLYLCTGTRMRDVQPGFILRQVASKKKVSNTRAALAGIRCQIERGSDEARRQWIHGLRGQVPDQLVNEVIGSWERRVAQGRFHYPKQDRTPKR